MTKRTRRRPEARGFTLIEILIVIGILGLITAISYPSILNVMAVRNLDNTTRQVQATLQQTKLRAIDAKVLHRVRFYQSDGGYWVYEMERFQSDGTWIRVPGSPRKTILQTLEVTMDLPVDGSDPVIVFSPIGTVVNFTVGQNSIVIRNPKLLGMNQDDERVISLFMGGSIQYARRKSG